MEKRRGLMGRRRRNSRVAGSCRGYNQSNWPPTAVALQGACQVSARCAETNLELVRANVCVPSW